MIVVLAGATVPGTVIALGGTLMWGGADIYNMCVWLAHAYPYDPFDVHNGGPERKIGPWGPLSPRGGSGLR